MKTQLCLNIHNSKLPNRQPLQLKNLRIIREILRLCMLVQGLSPEILQQQKWHRYRDRDSSSEIDLVLRGHVTNIRTLYTTEAYRIGPHFKRLCVAV